MDAPTRNCRASFPGGTERVRDLLSQKPKINNGTGGGETHKVLTVPDDQRPRTKLTHSLTARQGQ